MKPCTCHPMISNVESFPSRIPAWERFVAAEHALTAAHEAVADAAIELAESLRARRRGDRDDLLAAYESACVAEDAASDARDEASDALSAALSARPIELSEAA